MLDLQTSRQVATGFLRRDGESMPEPLSDSQTAATAMAVWGASAESLNGEVGGWMFFDHLLGVAPSQ